MITIIPMTYNLWSSIILFQSLWTIKFPTSSPRSTPRSKHQRDPRNVSNLGYRSDPCKVWFFTTCLRSIRSRCLCNSANCVSRGGRGFWGDGCGILLAITRGRRIYRRLGLRKGPINQRSNPRRNCKNGARGPSEHRPAPHLPHLPQLLHLLQASSSPPIFSSHTPNAPSSISTAHPYSFDSSESISLTWNLWRTWQDQKYCLKWSSKVVHCPLPV